MMYVVQNIHWFVLFIGALVLVHELGHFAVAKLVGVKVLAFSFGFGPRLFGFRRGETEYKVSVLPLGGYVKMLGEVPGQEIAPEELPRAFSSKSLWRRTAVVLAGPVANFVLAWVLFVGLGIGNHTFGDTKLGTVKVGEPAWEAGLRPGDRIVAVDGAPMRDWESLQQAIATRPGQALTVVYERDGHESQVIVTPAVHEETNPFKEVEERGRVGISPNYVKAYLGIVDTDSPAARVGLKTGDLIVKVGKIPVNAWHEVRQAVAKLKAGEPVKLTVKRGEQELAFAVVPEAAPAGLEIDLFSSADTDAPWSYTGLVSQESLVKAVEPNTPAATMGIQAGDRLLRLMMKKGEQVVERPIGVWFIDLMAFDGADARNDFALTYQRGREVLTRELKLLAREEKDAMKNVETRYVFGATNDISTLGQYQFERTLGLGEALMRANTAMVESATLVAKGLVKLATRKIPLKEMGGPIMMFQLAAISAADGWDVFLARLAMISVNLGLLNLLPIPVLDGGHLIMFTFEGIRRRPPSLKFREVANLVGLAILLALMVLVFHNDIRRFFLG